ncbi:MAG: tyrosine--tRNA ligase [bacterium]|nr:tyrosine--tRNA ligase [bacterium]
MNKDTNAIDTSEASIRNILERSVAVILPSKDELVKALQSGNRLKMYVGADATGPTLHLGHATNFMLLEKFRQLGHEIIVLFGDFTAMIGDPTDKDAARVTLSKEQVEDHIKSWKEQVGKILKLEDSQNPVTILKNSDWLSKLNFADVVGIASNFTVQQMIERDMFERRLNDKKPIYLHEFFYPLMQGYDSVAMNVDLEVGGTDQTFNMLAGRTLQRKYNNKDKFVISTTLLENPKTGKKLMSKSEGGFIGLNDSPQDMYGKTMALPDEAVFQVFVDCTYVPLGEVEELKKQTEAGTNPRDIKMRLARELVTLYHDAEKAKAAEENFVNTFAKGGVPDEVETVATEAGKLLVDIMVEKSIVASKSEWRRLIDEGAVSIVESEEKITDPFAKAEKSGVYKIGKRRFIKIEVN